MSQVQAVDGSYFRSTTLQSESTKSKGTTTFQAFLDSTQPATNTTSSASLESIFQKASDTYGIDIDLLKAVAKTESNFTANATSHAGAMGIMQLMPATARSLGVTDAYDPEQNIMGGAKLLASHLRKYNGNIAYALAAYNAGSGAVDSYGGIPPYQETQNYVKRILSLYDNTIEIPENASYTSNPNATLVTAEDIARAKEDARITKQLSDIPSNDLYLTSNTETIYIADDTEETTTSTPVSSSQETVSDSTQTTSSQDYSDFVDTYLSLISGFNKDSTSNLLTSSGLGSTSYFSNTSATSSLLSLLTNALSSSES